MWGWENFGGSNSGAGVQDMCRDQQLDGPSYPHLVQTRRCAEDEEYEESLPGIIECDDEP